MRRTYFFIICILALSVFLLSQCEQEKEKTVVETTDLLWRNLHDSVEYVGIQTCRSCHEDVYQTYIKTGMGQSLGKATSGRSDAQFGEHVLIHDQHLNMSYFPYWKNDSLFIHEFRISDGDTVHSRTEHVPYIIGSGHHTNSHLLDFNGYIYQAPVTFYTQKGEWDLAPGYEDGYNSRFERLIGLECMNCHNAKPEFDFRSENKFHTVPHGIDCENCHGPGSLHVQEKLAGIKVDTSKQADYSIVNPARLSVEKQMSVCQSCHLQGVAVLEEGKNFTDFRPGMLLSEVLNVFLPRFAGAEDEFIMASQAERLRMSDCFVESNRHTHIPGMSCITCHNPHISVRETQIKTFNAACINCHTDNQLSLCSEELSVRKASNDNCSGCHMPKSGSIDIPHVSITDHYIRAERLEDKQNITYEEIEKITRFVGLESMVQDNPTKVMRARGYLTFYERFSPRSYILDSAAALLFHTGVRPAKEGFNAIVHYYFLKEDYAAIINHSRLRPVENITDSWSLYRIGEAYFATGNYEASLPFFLQTVELKPLHLEFQNKLAVNYLQLGHFNEAKEIFEMIIEMNPKNKVALSNLGFILFREFQFEEAEKLLQKAVNLDPDYENAVFNLAMLLTEDARVGEAVKLIENFTKQHPDNEQASAFLRQLKGI